MGAPVAGERKGITYEAIVKVALEELVRKGKLTGTVFWNEKPDAMTIEPDFTIGPDKDRPTHVFLVNHSGSAKNSDMKFWRNMGELAEAKIRLPKPARVYSVVFDAAIKEDLKALQEAAFDGQLQVGAADYGRRLQWWVEANSPGLPKDAEEKVETIRDAMKDKARTDNPKSLIDEFVRELGKLVETERTELDALWLMERKRSRGRAPASRETFLRRGVGKLLLLDHPDDIDPAGRFKKTVSGERIVALKTMGLAGDSIGGPRVTDPELLWAVRSLPSDALTELHKIRQGDRIAEWIEALLGLSALKAQLDYIGGKWAKLCEGAGLYAELKRCHEQPWAVAPTLITSSSRRVWLFHLLVEWIKLVAGTRTAYGLAQLVEDVDRLARDAAHKKAVKAILAREPNWQAKRSVELGLTDWHSSPSKQHFGFADDDLARVADALARRLAQIRKPTASDQAQFVEAVIQSVLEAKLLTYRNFKPFEVLLARELTKAGIAGSMEVAVRACFAEAASDAGAQLDPRSSGTTVMRVKNTLINWQSASDEGRDHKKKELCGRAPALRYTWDTKQKAFAKRPSTDKLILIVDGTWRQDDLDALEFAGWDEIFYPDEMNKLVKAIV
jgi:hypothetical protein